MVLLWSARVWSSFDRYLEIGMGSLGIGRRLAVEIEFPSFLQEGKNTGTNATVEMCGDVENEWQNCNQERMSNVECVCVCEEDSSVPFSREGEILKCGKVQLLFPTIVFPRILSSDVCFISRNGGFWWDEEREEAWEKRWTKVGNDVRVSLWTERLIFLLPRKRLRGGGRESKWWRVNEWMNEWMDEVC